MKRRNFLKSSASAAALSWPLAKTLRAANRLGALVSPGAEEGPADPQGVYFAKKHYTPTPLPQFDALRDRLPSPIDEEHALWIETYWKAWELGFHNFREPAPGSGFVSQFIDAAFNQNIFLWDSCFMSMFCNFAWPLVPGISSLDNFCAKQHEDGEISREIVRATGVDFGPWIDREDKPLFSRWGWPSLAGTVDEVRDQPVHYEGRAAPTPNPRLTLDALNNPILAWAELEHYRVTGDRARLEEVWPPLVHYYAALEKYLRQGNGLYVTDWASMDNSPRNAYLKNGGMGVDISAQMVLFARQLAEIADILGKPQDASRYRDEAEQLAGTINQLMWDGQKKFYYDVQLDGGRAPIKTIAAYWTLLAEVASKEQATDLVAELNNPQTFQRLNRVPTLAADQPGYDPQGGYWRGSVWAPTDTMVIRGLENYGYDDLAREVAINHLNLVANVFKTTGTIWENYAPDAEQPGKPAKGDFVGWSGIGPIMYLLEYGIGLRADARHNELLWRLESDKRVGCERFRFNGHVVSLMANPPANGRTQVSVHSDGAFVLRVRCQGTEKQFSVHAGEQQFELTSPVSKP
jgi:hypothetical protein